MSQVRRRRLLLAAGSLVIVPLAGWAQQTSKIPRIGVLWPMSSPDAWDAAFREGQIASEYLTAAEVEAAAADLRYVVNSMGRVDGHEHVSRVDPCVDLVPSIPVAYWNVRQRVTRARQKAAYWLGDDFSGWRIGLRGAIQSRFYDKVTEIVEKSHKAYLFELWATRGWKAGEPVWRQELQDSRAALKELRIDSVAPLLSRLGAVWNYLIHDWLRLTEPSEDSNRSRWRNHPLWDVVAGVSWGEVPQPTLKRIRSSAAPRDE